MEFCRVRWVFSFVDLVIFRSRYSLLHHFTSLSLKLVVDVTDVAVEWAERNVKDNPQVSELIEVRRVEAGEYAHIQDNRLEEQVDSTDKTSLDGKLHFDADMGFTGYYGPPVLLGVVREGETFDFCMCNPPFFETMEESGLNPRTACGGTPQEMVCPGGEKAFISRIIEDSVMLKQTFRYYY